MNWFDKTPIGAAFVGGASRGDYFIFAHPQKSIAARRASHNFSIHRVSTHNCITHSFNSHNQSVVKEALNELF
jgi:hypothetical protein